MILDHESFQPPLLWRNGHLQTMRAALSREGHWPYQACQHILDTTEGDQLVLHEDVPRGEPHASRCVLLIHGLGGSHLSPYMVRIAHKLRERGIRTFRLDMRGCGAGWPLAQRPGHAGRSEDLAAAIYYIRQLLPSHQLAVVGFSLGGNIVLKLLGEWGHHAGTSVERAMAVAPPIDLRTCALNIQRPSMYFYNRWFIRSLLTTARRRAVVDPEVADCLRGPLPRNLYEFDDRVTAPLSGFAGADDYYARCSSASVLGKVSVPSLILTSADDPLVPCSIFSSLRSPARISLQVTRHGGHVGFFSQPGPRADPYWLDRRVVHFVTAPAERHRHYKFDLTGESDLTGDSALAR